MENSTKGNCMCHKTIRRCPTRKTTGYIALRYRPEKPKFCKECCRTDLSPLIYEKGK